MGDPSQHLGRFYAKPYIEPWVPIVSLAKGLELNIRKMRRLTEIIEEPS
jgi:glycerol-3-phosphate dehydrogenase (NAD(P)+)